MPLFRKVSVPLAVVISTALAVSLAGCNGSRNVAASGTPSLSSSAIPVSVSPSATASASSPTPQPTHAKPARHSTRPTATRTPSPSPTTATPTHHATPTPTTTPTGSDETSAYDYTFPVAGCSADPSSSHHDYPASDIWAARWCRFVAVVAGVVDEVQTTDPYTDPANRSGATKGGRFVSIVGVDGVRYYGSHLQKVADGIRPGVRVRKGQLLGYVGNSGNAAGIPTQVHFGISWPTPPGIWWVRRGMVWPQRYLASWRAGGNLSPRAEVARLHSEDGTVPKCQSDC